MDGVTCVLLRQASDTDQLYGSVTAGDIAKALTEEGFTVNKTQVLLDRPIKVIGLYPLRVKLHPEVGVNVIVNVARTQEEADAQTAAANPPDAAAGDEDSAPPADEQAATEPAAGEPASASDSEG